DCGVRTDAEREREHGHGRVRRAFPQIAKRVNDVLPKMIEHGDVQPPSLIRGASPLGFPDTLSRSPLRRLAPFAWLARDARSLLASTSSALARVSVCERGSSSLANTRRPSRPRRLDVSLPSKVAIRLQVVTKTQAPTGQGSDDSGGDVGRRWI